MAKKVKAKVKMNSVSIKKYVPTRRPDGGSRLSAADAQSLGKYFDALRSRHKRLDAELIVKDSASNPSSPARRHMTWDDKVAAHKHRIDEAKYLLANVSEVVKVASGDYTVRSFLAVKVDGTGSEQVHKWERATDVMEDPVLRDQIIERAITEARSWVTRYEPYVELEPITKAIKSVIDKKEKSKSAA